MDQRRIDDEGKEKYDKGRKKIDRRNVD